MSTSRGRRNHRHRQNRPRPGSGRAASADPDVVVKARGPQDIVAAVPYLCGFHPHHSVVVVSLRGPRRRFGLVSRMDLPAPEKATEAAGLIAGFAARDEGNGAFVVLYDDLEWSAERRPHAAFVTALSEALGERGVPALEVLYVTGERYWSYSCEDLHCCPRQGRSVAEASSSPIAAAYVVAGEAPLADRAAIGARLRPASALLVAAVEDSVWRWLAAQAADLDGGAARSRPAPLTASTEREHLRRWTGQTFRLMAALVGAYRRGGPEIGIEQAGQLLAALDTRDIRDAVLMGFCQYGMAPPEDLGPLLDIGFDPALAVVDNGGAAPGAAQSPQPETDEAVERLLVDLCRRVDGPMACAPLTLLAWHSWARGHGALARVAVERALEFDPTYRLAVLLLSALDHALAPEWVSESRHADEQVR